MRWKALASHIMCKMSLRKKAKKPPLVIHCENNTVTINSAKANAHEIAQLVKQELARDLRRKRENQ